MLIPDPWHAVPKATLINIGARSFTARRNAHLALKVTTGFKFCPRIEQQKPDHAFHVSVHVSTTGGFGKWSAPYLLNVHVLDQGPLTSYLMTVIGALPYYEPTPVLSVISRY